jgi:hypothetical protein
MLRRALTACNAWPVAPVLALCAACAGPPPRPLAASRSAAPALRNPAAPEPSSDADAAPALASVPPDTASFAWETATWGGRPSATIALSYQSHATKVADLAAMLTLREPRADSMAVVASTKLSLDW